MGLQFGILGPMHVSDGGTEVSLGTLKQRTLLTALLLQPNRAIALDRLVAALWEESPPRSAVANLRTYANRLRKRLPGSACSTAPSRIVARLPGYLLSVCPGELDALAFTEHHRLGREALRTGDLTGAADALQTCLELWRGTAAEDIPRTPELAWRLAALDEQRWNAVEDLMHVRLLLGANTEVAAELRGLIADNPVRERLWAHLILALYRTGDAAAALDAYRSARCALRENLGLEPGDELTLLQSRILNRDPELAGPVPVGGPARLAFWLSGR